MTILKNSTHPVLQFDQKFHLLKYIAIFLTNNWRLDMLHCSRKILTSVHYFKTLFKIPVTFPYLHSSECWNHQREKNKNDFQLFFKFLLVPYTVVDREAKVLLLRLVVHLPRTWKSLSNTVSWNISFQIQLE